MSEEEQRAENASAQKDRKGISFKLDISNLMNLAIIGLLTWGINMVQQTHDEVTGVKGKIESVADVVKTQGENIKVLQGLTAVTIFRSEYDPRMQSI